jgi:hypothetical protein
MVFHPRVDGGIALDSTVKTEQCLRPHRFQLSSTREGKKQLEGELKSGIETDLRREKPPRKAPHLFGAERIKTPKHEIELVKDRLKRFKAALR